MFSKLTWYSMLFIAFVAFSLLSLGFVKAIQVTGNNNINKSNTIVTNNNVKEEYVEKPTITKDPNSFNILVMGDSIAFGTGDEKGKGFLTYLPNYLKPQTTKKLIIENIGINGQESIDLLEQIQNDKPKALISTSDIVVISIGGNDLRRVRSRNNTSVDENEYKAIEKAYIKNLKATIDFIRKDNLGTYIVFVGLYNPYEEESTDYTDTAFMNTWNANTQKLFESDPRAIYIPTYDLFKYNLKRFIAPDGLHPNSLGYEAISHRISKSIENIFN